MTRPLTKCVRHLRILKESRSLNKARELNRTACTGCILATRSNEDRMLTSVENSRTFFTLPSSPFGNKRKEYAERRLLGYSMNQMYDIVAAVDKYHLFVPWCTQSSITHADSGQIKCKLQIGFPPLVERYTSVMTVSRPNLVKSVCADGKLFDHLVTTWEFSPGLSDNPNSCNLNFCVSFEFRSQLHSQLSHLFFDEVVRVNVNAFLKRAKVLHGPASIKAQKPQIRISNS